MIDPASFRDPSGFVFHSGGRLFRQVNESYRSDYDALIGSGLYQEMTARGLLIPHEEVGLEEALSGTAYRVLKPRVVPFISYPYEWCFSQLKEAARATLESQRLALDHDMVLKDASAYNIQFVDGRPLLIDTLSFERHQPGAPWIAYRQFCQHFLAPLALASSVDIRLLALARSHIDGIPLDLASSLLPLRSRLQLGLLLHLHLHARSQRKHSRAQEDGSPARARLRPITKQQLLGIVDSLSATIGKLEWRPAGTEWADYTETTHYGDDDRADKERLVREFLERADAKTVLDLGANTGHYSRIAADLGCRTISCDGDPAAVEKNYRRTMSEGEERIHPLLIDLANPSPSLGWNSSERASWGSRSKADLVLALALVHHLAIGNNVPLSRLAEFLAGLGRFLVVEWVPKADQRVRQLLASREDVFSDYNRASFEAAFGSLYAIEAIHEIGATGRTLYLMRRAR